MASATMMATYEKALERATVDGIVIVGRGVRKSDGAQVVYTSSASNAACHEVVIGNDHMSCDCHAGKRGQYCKHRAIVRADLVSKALEASARLERKPVQPAPVAPRLERVRGINDTAPISIWK